MSIFLDTSYLYAGMVPHDQWHKRAMAAPLPGTAVTTSLIVNETVGLLQIRGFFSLALEFLHQIRKDNAIEIVYPDRTLQGEGWDLLPVQGMAGAGAVDCSSFALMKQRRIRLAYTFDDHFRHAGFETLLTSK